MNKKLLVNKITTCLMAVLMLVLMGGELRVYATETNPLHEKLVTAQSSYLKQNETNSLKPFALGSNDTYKSIIQTTPELTQTAVNAPSSSKLFKTTLATKGLNMRSGPGTSNPVIVKIPYGTKVEILKLGSSWSQINHRGKIGYVATRYLGALPSSPNDSGTDYLVTARVNFRSGPGSAYKSYGRLAAGTELIVLAKNGSWYQVSYQGRTGYIHFNYLKKKSNSSDKPADPKSDNSSYIVEKTVNFRSGPSASYQSYGLLSQGTKVEVLSTAGSWYQVNYQGRTGYIHSSYLKKESETPTKPLIPDVKTTTYIAEKRVNFRQDSKNSSNILSKIMPGVEVELIATSGTWSKIIHNGVTGFVASSYLKKEAKADPALE